MNPSEPTESVAPCPLQALVVDDSAVDAELLMLTLRRHGYAVRWRVADSAETVRRALAERPEIVFTDCNMGQFDARAVLAIMHELAPDVPVVVVTGSANDEAVTRLLRNGAAGFLLKDDLGELGAVVARVLQSRPRNAPAPSP